MYPLAVAYNARSPPPEVNADPSGEERATMEAPLNQLTPLETPDAPRQKSVYRVDQCPQADGDDRRHCHPLPVNQSDHLDEPAHDLEEPDDSKGAPPKPLVP